MEQFAFQQPPKNKQRRYALCHISELIASADSNFLVSDVG